MPTSRTDPAQRARDRDAPGARFGRAWARHGKSAAEALNFAVPRREVPRVDLPEGILVRLSGSDEFVLRAFLETLARKQIVGLGETTCFTRRFASELTKLDERTCRMSIRRLRALGLMRQTEVSIDTGRFHLANVYTAPGPLLDDLPTTAQPLSSSTFTKKRRSTTRSDEGPSTSQPSQVLEPLTAMAVQGLTTGQRVSVTPSRCCESCGRDISHRRADATTCSARCRVRLYRQRLHAPASEHLI